MVLFLSTSLLAHSIHTHINLQDPKDFLYVGGALAAGIVGTALATHYYHPAALEKAKIAAEQADKRAKERNEREEQQRKEQAEKERIQASIILAKLHQDYAQETEALNDNKGLTREKFTTIVKSKQSLYSSRFEDYYRTLISNINSLHTIGILLSSEEKNTQKNLLKQLETIKYIFNSKLNEEINAEIEEAKRIKRLEEAEERKKEREQLEIRKLRGDVEAQQTIKKTYDAVNLVMQRLESMEQRQISTQKTQDLEFASLRRQLNGMVENVQNIVSSARAQLATLFMQRFEKTKEAVRNAQSIQQPTVVNQVPPPYNPAAVSALPTNPSEAVDEGAIPLPTPPPTYL